MIKRLIFALALTVIFTGACTTAPPQEPRQATTNKEPEVAMVHEAVSFCLPGEDVNLIKEVFKRGDETEYWRIMKDTGSECFDVRVLGMEPLKVSPIRELFKVCHSTGKMMSFALLQDTDGRHLVSWAMLNIDCTPSRSA